MSERTAKIHGLMVRIKLLPCFYALLASLTLSLHSSGHASSQEGPRPPVVLDSNEKYQVSSHLEILKDEDKSLSKGDVASPQYSGKFRGVKDSIPNLGITNSAVWARFRVKNPDETPRHLLLSYDYALSDLISFFVPEEKKEGFERLDAGYSTPESFDKVQTVRHRYHVFPLTVPAMGEITCFLRVESKANMVLPVTLWTRDALAQQDHNDQMIFGIFFGVLLAFIIYFAAVSIKLHNPTSMWFIIYITFLGLLMASYQGFLQEQLERTRYGWHSTLLIIIIGLLYFTGAKFLRTFLNVRFYSRWIDNVLIGLQWMGLGFIPMNFFPNTLTPLYGFILVGAGPIFSTTISVVLWVRGVPNAKYFALGWIIGHLTSELDLLRVFGISPWVPAMGYLIPAALFSSIIFFSIAIVEQSREYRYFANRDGLTGLANRRYFDEVLDREWNRNMRNLKPLSIIMADVDSFKAYNDNYGHKSGDECLTAIGRAFTQNVKRAGDMAARYGGEEFVVLLSETSTEEAMVLAEKIRSAVEGMKIPHASSRVKKYVTISLGVASMVPGQEIKSSDLIKHADMALYRAKKGGRNRIVPI